MTNSLFGSLHCSSMATINPPAEEISLCNSVICENCRRTRVLLTDSLNTAIIPMMVIARLAMNMFKLQTF